MTIEHNETRSLIIKNYRNLGAFYNPGNPSTEEQAVLKINRSLKRDDLGGLVFLIGSQNHGKTNVLRALEAYSTGKIHEKDYNNFVWSDGERTEPTFEMKIGNGSYLEIDEDAQKYSKLRGKNRFELEGQYLVILIRALATYEAYENARLDNRFGTNLPLRNYLERLHNLVSNVDTLRTNADLIRSLIGHNLVLGENGEDFLDYSVTLDHDHINGRTKAIMSLTPIDVEKLYSDRNRYDGSCLREMFRCHFEMKELPAITDKYGENENSKFYETYGYTLSNNVFVYKREKISQSDLHCPMDAPNHFFKNVLKITGFSENTLKQAYSNNGLMRNNLEKKINSSLKNVSKELNEIFHFSADENYQMEIKLESEQLRFFISSGNDVPVDLDCCSQGFQYVFEMFFNLLKVEKFEPGDMIAIDEYGCYLGPLTVKELTEQLRRYAKKNALTFILTTQNTMAVDPTHLDEVRLVIREYSGNARVINEFDQFENGHDTLSPVASGLMMPRNFMRSENRRTVFVEGVTDYFYLNAFAKQFRKRGSDFDVDFVSTNGLGQNRNESEKWVEQILSIERMPIILTDGDGVGKKHAEYCKKKNISPSTLTEIFEDGTKVTIEDLFSDADAEKYGIDKKEKKDKFFDNAACFSHKLEDIFDELEDETRENFRKTIDYVCGQ